MKDIKKIIMVSAVSVVVAGTAGFFIGKNTVGDFRSRMGSNFPSGNNYGKNMAGNFNGSGNTGGRTKDSSMISGEVISKDDSGFVMKLRDGGSKIVIAGDGLSVSKSVSGTISDISVGTTVFVTGSANADGSIEAKSADIRQSMPAEPKAK